MLWKIRSGGRGMRSARKAAPSVEFDGVDTQAVQDQRYELADAAFVVDDEAQRRRRAVTPHFGRRRGCGIGTLWCNVRHLIEGAKLRAREISYPGAALKNALGDLLTALPETENALRGGRRQCGILLAQFGGLFRLRDWP